MWSVRATSRIDLSCSLTWRARVLASPMFRASIRTEQRRCCHALRCVSRAAPPSGRVAPRVKTLRYVRRAQRRAAHRRSARVTSASRRFDRCWCGAGRWSGGITPLSCHVIAPARDLTRTLSAEPGDVAPTRHPETQRTRSRARLDRRRAREISRSLRCRAPPAAAMARSASRRPSIHPVGLGGRRYSVWSAIGLMPIVIGSERFEIL